jgi:hypothetical protein
MHDHLSVILNINLILVAMASQIWIYYYQLGIYLDYTSRLVCPQCQIDSVCCDLSSAFDLVPHTVLLHKHCAYGLSEADVTWLCSYLTVHYFVVWIHNIYSTLLNCFLVYLKDTSMFPCLMYLLMTFVILFIYIFIFIYLFICDFKIFLYSKPYNWLYTSTIWHWLHLQFMCCLLHET